MNSPIRDSLEQSRFSIGDSVGLIFQNKASIYRAINKEFIPQTKELMGCGLIQALVEKGLFPETKISNIKIDGYDLVLEHEKIEPVIYPFEWSPEMLRKAGLCVLEVNKIANEYGYELKDAHPFNVIFKYQEPIFIDFGSIAKISNYNSWIAYDEFINSYFTTLRLVDKGYANVYKHAFLLKGNLDNNELLNIVSIRYRVLGIRKTRIVQKILSAYRRRFSIDANDIKRRVGNMLLAKIINKALKFKMLPSLKLSNTDLANKIKKISFSRESVWGNYHQSAGYYDRDGEIILTKRMQWIIDTVKNLQPTTIIELAGNQGILSRKLSSLPSVQQVICSDYDDKSIDQLIRKSQKDDKVFAACFDFMADVSHGYLGSRNERLKCDLVIALAVTHHLLLTQRYSIDAILSTIAGYTNKYIIIEFMPLGLWDGNTAGEIPEWYNESWFHGKLNNHFQILSREKLEPNRIAFVCEVFH